MKRAIVLLLLALVILAVIRDPFSFFETASDSRWPAPWWRILLTLSEIGCLMFAAAYLWLRRYDTALRLILAEAMFNVAIVAVQVRHYGIKRFLEGYGASEYLSWYLLTVLTRLVLVSVLALQRTPREEAESHSTRVYAANSLDTRQ